MPEESERFRVGQAPPPEGGNDGGPAPLLRPVSPQPAPEPMDVAPLPSPEEPTARAEPDAIEPGEARRLGADLARALQEGDYYPVVLFGTSNSGKTSLLLSLFASLATEPALQAGLGLCDPLLGTATSIGRQLHAEAKHTFDVKTQAFIEGEKIPKTVLQAPFFIPVELTPVGGPAVRFAFLESNGEWYRPHRERDRSIVALDSLYQELRSEIEDFIATYQGGITFLYLTPYTQGEVYSDRDATLDRDELQNASLAISGVLRAYNAIRASHRDQDRHVLLVTKWDAHSAKSLNRAEDLEEDSDAVQEFCGRRYAQALSSFRGLAVATHQKKMNAYCSGIINERGLLQLRSDDAAQAAVKSYPIRLWKWLYGNALTARGLSAMSPFPEPPEPAPLAKAWRNLVDFMSGAR